MFVPLRGGEAVQSDGLCSVLRNTSTELKRLAEALLPVQPLPLLEQSFALRSSVTLCRDAGAG